MHAVGGWLGFSAVRRLGPRLGRYDKGRTVGIPPSSIPWLAMGSWLLCIGWFGFNVMSAQTLQTVTGLVAMNSLMAMCGGILAALIAGDGDPGFIHNGALAGLVAVCAGSDVMHPIGSLFVGGVAGVIFVYAFQAGRPQVAVRRRARRVAAARLVRAVGRHRLRHLRADDVRRHGRRQLLVAACRQRDGRGLCGAVAGFIIYPAVDMLFGFRLAAEDERRGADLSIHKIGANPEEDVRMGRV